MTTKDRIEYAKQGREYWLNLVRENDITLMTYVLLVPDADGKYSGFIRDNLAQFLNSKKIQKVIILTRDQELNNFSMENISVQPIRESDAKALLQFYCLYEFAANFIVASLDEPASRRGCGYVNKGNLTQEEIFKASILGLTDD